MLLVALAKTTYYVIGKTIWHFKKLSYLGEYIIYFHISANHNERCLTEKGNDGTRV